MKNISLAILVSVSLFVFSVPSHAHEGNHDAPGMVEAPKGGDVKAIENAYIEVLAHDSEVKIYLYTKDLKPITNAQDFTLTAEAQLPRTKIMQPLNLTEKNGIFSTSFRAKGAHRYTIVLKIKDAKIGHEDRLNFTIEPRR